VDSATAIHALERFAATATVEAPVVAATRPERVAAVGSGPAGLSCAYHLAKRGYRVTVFEAEPMAGGMLRAIPEYRLPEVVLNQEIAFVESTGVTIKTGMRLGENLTVAELDAFDAVFLAIGAGREKMLNIPGIDSDRVIGSLSFLKKARQGEVQCAGERVLVLGGGNVAFDCARMARRLGASEVHLTCLEASDGMLADASEIQQAEEEGIVIHPSRSFCRVIREAGEATGVECLSLSSMCFEEDGRLTIDPIAGSEHILPASMVIVAIGATPDVTFLPDTVSVSRGMILTDPTGATSRARYFAGGDATASTRRVAYAIASGKQAALSIDRFLNGAKVDLPQMPSRVTSKLIDPDAFEKKARTDIPTLPAEERQRGLKEVELGFSPEQAAAEANRCLDCRGMCKLVCRYDAPQFGTESNAKMQKCIFCSDRLAEGKKAICVDACGQYALDCGPLDVLQAKYGDMSYAVGFEYSDKMKPSIIFKPKPRKESQNV
jgi:NADH-quinone oxidoreductase subunit F